MLKLTDFGKKEIRSVGWIAQEVNEPLFEETGTIDVFPAGCLLYYVSTGGIHPFASKASHVDQRVKLDLEECQSEIRKKAVPNLQLIRQRQTTLDHLISWMIDHSPEERPQFQEILSHPFFWSSETTLEFIRNLSDSIEFQGKGTPEQELVINRIEENKDQVFDNDWRELLTTNVKKQLDKKRRKPYNGSTVHNLLRAIRNKVFLFI